MKNVTKKLGFGSALLGASAAALADVPATVTTAIGDAQADALSVGWVVVGVLAALFVFKIIKRLI